MGSQRRRTAHERGFTMAELLVGIGMLVIITGAAALALTSTVAVVTHNAAAHARLVGVDGTTSALLDDAAGAVAVGQDGSGACSAAPAGQVVFVNGSPGGGVHTITYAQNGSTVTRYDSATQQTTVIPGLTGLSASCATGDQLPSRVPELAGIATHDTRMRALPQSAALGGTTLVDVTLSTPTLQRDVHVIGAIAPSGFTVKGHMQWHAVLWRVDQTHRFWFGFAGKSHYWVYGGVWVTYDNWATSEPWCSEELYHDANGDYSPGDPKEHATAVFAYCKASGVPFPPPNGSGNTFVIPPNISDCTRIDGTVTTGTCPPIPLYSPPATHVSSPPHVGRPCTPGDGGGNLTQSVRRTRNVSVGVCTPTDPPDPSATATATPSPAPQPTGGAECLDYIVAQASAGGVDPTTLFDGYTNTITVNGAAATLPGTYATYHWTDANGNSIDGLYLSGATFSQLQQPPANSVAAVDMDGGNPRNVANFIPVALLPTDGSGQPSGSPIGYVCVPES